MNVLICKCANVLMVGRYGVLLCSIILAACSDLDKPVVSEFTYEIPRPWGKDSINRTYKYKNIIADQLSLTRLEDGVDSFELRLWSAITIAQPEHLNILKKTKTGWQCMTYRIWSHATSLKNINLAQYIVDSVQVFTRISQYDWSLFLDSLKNEHLLTLPTEDDINGFENSVMDGTVHYVEYATPLKYKFYIYSNPDAYPEIPECRHMNNILGIWARNVGGVFYRPSKISKSTNQ